MLLMYRPISSSTPVTIESFLNYVAEWYASCFSPYSVKSIPVHKHTLLRVSDFQWQTVSVFWSLKYTIWYLCTDRCSLQTIRLPGTVLLEFPFVYLSNVHFYIQLIITQIISFTRIAPSFCQSLSQCRLQCMFCQQIAHFLSVIFIVKYRKVQFGFFGQQIDVRTIHCWIHKWYL